MKKLWLFLALVPAILCGCDPTEELSEGMEPVDLGLSVKWASCNLGGTVATDNGGYCAWGETLFKVSCMQENYSLYDEEDGFTKYCTNSAYGTKDDLSQLLPEDDIAAATAGEGWRIPTEAEWQELLEKCTWKWTRLNKVPGCRITASNGHWIFLPAAGNRTNALVAEQSGGYYWSASLDLRFSDQATSLLVEAPRAELVAQPRFMGLSIRPVCQ